MRITDEDRMDIDVKELSRAQKKGLKELGKTLSIEDPFKNRKFESLEDHPELIEREWTTKKGIEMIEVKGLIKTQLRKDEMKCYSVDIENGNVYKGIYY